MMVSEPVSEEYGGKWIACRETESGEQIIAVGSTLDEVESQIDPAELENVIFELVPPATFFVGPHRAA